MGDHLAFTVTKPNSPFQSNGLYPGMATSILLLCSYCVTAKVNAHSDSCSDFSYMHFYNIVHPKAALWHV